MAPGNADRPDDVFALPGTSAARLYRYALIGQVGGGAVAVTAVAGLFAFKALGTPFPGALIGVAILGAVLSLGARLIGLAAARREQAEADAGYTTVRGRPNLPRLDGRTGAPVVDDVSAALAPTVNAVSAGTSLLAGGSVPVAPEGERFRRRFPLVLGVLGLGAVVAVVLVGRLWANARRSGDLGSQLSILLWVAVPLVVLLALVFWYLGATAASRVNRVRAIRPDAVVFCSAVTVDGVDAFGLLGATGQLPRYRFAVAADSAGLEFRRMDGDEVFLRLPWSAVSTIEPGIAAVRGASSVRAIRLGGQIGGRTISLPLPVVDPRLPWMYPVGAANARLDELRVLRGEAQRAGRSHTAASGGSVSSTDAGRPAQGSSEATTEP